MSKLLTIVHTINEMDYNERNDLCYFLAGMLHALSVIEVDDEMEIHLKRKDGEEEPK